MEKSSEWIKMRKRSSEEAKNALYRSYQELNRIAQRGQILFTGSSLMEQFPVNEIAMSMGINRIIYNRGVGGTTTDDFLEHMDIVLLDLAPEKVFINIGTNDMMPRSDGEYWQDHLLRNYETILQMIKEKLPDTKVYIMAYYPVNPQIPNIPEWTKYILKIRTNAALNDTNEKLAVMALKYGYHYIDCCSKLRDKDGNQKAEFSKDGIHMYPVAYMEVFRELCQYL